MDKELRDLEQQLGRLNPSVMPADMLARMETAMQRWQNHVTPQDKIIPFEAISPQKTHNHHRSFTLIASAAAIALIGAVSVMLKPSEKAAPEVAQSSPEPALVAPSSAATPPSGIALTSNPRVGSSILNSSDDTITYDENGRPMRVVSVELIDELKIKDAHGREFTIKRPRTEHYLVPVEVH